MVDIKIQWFFDKPKVLAAVKDGTKSAEAKMGAHVRQRAKTSIRKRKKTAQPGSPPSSHLGILRDRIFFGYDVSHEVTVVGPTLFRSNNPTGPQLLEFGGRTISWRTKKPVTYAAFPFMRPAMDAEIPNFPGLYANVI
jgi:hypothetical protein